MLVVSNLIRRLLLSAVRKRPCTSCADAAVLISAEGIQVIQANHLSLLTIWRKLDASHASALILLLQLETAHDQHTAEAARLQVQLQDAGKQHAAELEAAQAAAQQAMAAAQEDAKQQIDQGLQSVRWDLQAAQVGQTLCLMHDCVLVADICFPSLPCM